MKFLVFTLVSIYSLDSFALFQQIYTRYNKSDRLEGIKLQSPIDREDFKLNLSKYDWTLQYGGTYSSSSQESIYSFQGQETSSVTHNFDLRRPTFKYGTFAYSHNSTKYDLSKWSSTSLENVDNEIQFESKNTLSYSYELINKLQHLDYEVVHTQDLANKKNLDVKEQQDHYEFFNAYISAKLMIMLDRLYNDSENRAIKRINLVTNRVRDGLSRRVDLNQSKLALLDQKETIIRNTASLREKIVILEEIIGFEIKESDYHLVNWTYKDKQKYQFLYDEKSFPELERIELQQKLATLKVDQFDESLDHSLSLSLSYSKSSIEDDHSKAFSDSLSGNGKEAHVVALTYRVPISFDRRSASKNKLLAIKNKNELDLRNLKGDLIVQSKVLKENIDRYIRAINILDEKVNIAEKVVTQNTQLYNRGKISFEELLRSEDNLVATKISKMNMYALYEQSLGKLAFINGDIYEFLTQYVD